MCECVHDYSIFVRAEMTEQVFVCGTSMCTQVHVVPNLFVVIQPLSEEE